MLNSLNSNYCALPSLIHHQGNLSIKSYGKYINSLTILRSKNPCKTGTRAVFKETFNSKNGLEFSYKNRIVQTIDTTNPP